MLSSWFVSASAGSDSNPGTLAQPFASIQKASNLAQPGDAVLIRGGVYHETVTPAHSGTANAPITYEPYNGEQVVIDGADAVTGWTQFSGSIYKAPQSWDLGDGNNQVFAGGQMMTEARWPNSGLDPLHPALATADSIVATVNANTYSYATVTNSTMTQPQDYWVGATIHISPGQGWVWQTGVVIASSPGTITYAYHQLTSYEVPATGNSFYLSGKFPALDAAGEFYHDTTAGLLYAWEPDGAAPTSIESKSRQYAFDLSNLSYVNIQNMQIKAATILTNGGSSHIALSGLNASFITQRMDNLIPWDAKYSPGTTGIILNGTYETLSNSWIAYSSGNGVSLGGSFNTVQNTTISNVDYAGGDEAAISILGNNNTVLHDVIYNTGRSGITFFFSAHTQILNSVIHDIGLETSDAGAVYTWHTDGQGSRIADNILYNCHGPGYGNTGLFLDDNTANVVCDHNVIYNADAALKMNGVSQSDLIYNNTLLAGVSPIHFHTYFKNPSALIEGAKPSMPGSILKNNIMIGSVMFVSGATQNHNLFSFTSAKFVDPANANYQLLAGSAAINTGVVIAPYTNGFVSFAPDIGAYEYGAAAFQAGLGVSAPGKKR